MVALAFTHHSQRWRRVWSSRGVALMLLYDAHREFVLSCSELPADETPEPTRTGLHLAYARSGLGCLTRCGVWSGTLVCDGYG